MFHPIVFEKSSFCKNSEKLTRIAAGNAGKMVFSENSSLTPIGLFSLGEIINVKYFSVKVAIFFETESESFSQRMQSEIPTAAARPGDDIATLINSGGECSYVIFNGQMNTINKIKSYQDDMIGFLKELVYLESPTQTKAAVDRCSARMVKELKKYGAAVTRYPQEKRGDLFAADFPGPETFAPLMVLLHIDTVWPVGTLKKMPFSIQENRIYGPGVLDMKAGSVMTVFVLKYLQDNQLKPSRPIRIFINSSEEMPWKESDNLITGLAEQAGPVLCLEPALPGGGIKYQRKGRMTVRVSARGKSAHAANPEKGVNAIELLTNTLQEILELRGNGVTVNIGRIRGGGKLNIVPDLAAAGLEIRYWTMEKAQAVKKALHGMENNEAENQVKITLLTQTPPMEPSEAGDHLFHQTQKIASQLGLSLERGKSGGGSDASVASAAGAAVLDGLGPEGEGMHADHEHLIISSWQERTALLAELFQNV